jgi:5-formyltetrahydrofolate cyclo-ligase
MEPSVEQIAYPHSASLRDMLPPQPTKGQLRHVLAHRRRVIPGDLVDTTRWKVINHLRTLICERGPSVVALYSATHGEIDLTPLAHELADMNYALALPRVVYRGHPLTFNIWHPGEALEPDALGIPSATGAEILPAMMVIPMVGYTRQGYRLGYGQGYYDHTLASFLQPVFTVGVCHTELEMQNFPAEAHDRPLNAVVTGKEVIRCTPATPQRVLS